MDTKKTLKKQSPKIAVTMSLNSKVHKEFVELMKSQFPEATLSSFINTILEQGIEDLKEIQEYEELVEDKLTASELMKLSIKKREDKKETDTPKES